MVSMVTNHVIPAENLVVSNFLTNNHFVTTDLETNINYDVFGYLSSAPVFNPLISDTEAANGDTCFVFNIPIGPIVFKVSCSFGAMNSMQLNLLTFLKIVGCVNVPNSSGSLTVCVEVPSLGCVPLGELSGDLITGISATFNIPILGSGTIIFTIGPNGIVGGTWLIISGRGVILGRNVDNFNIPIFQIGG
jgi:hypothetical protein